MEIVKTCDLTLDIALKIFKALNPDKIRIRHTDGSCVVVTDSEPRNLVYPEGWYYAKGCFRNKHTSTTGLYSEAEMVDHNGRWWREMATYSTRSFD